MPVLSFHAFTITADSVVIVYLLVKFDFICEINTQTHAAIGC